MTHGRAQGRGFRLGLTAEGPDADTLRIEVTDARGDRAPRPRTTAPDPTADFGRGLLLVEALVTR